MNVFKKYEMSMILNTNTWWCFAPTDFVFLVFDANEQHPHRQAPQLQQFNTSTSTATSTISLSLTHPQAPRLPTILT